MVTNDPLSGFYLFMIKVLSEDNFNFKAKKLCNVKITELFTDVHMSLFSHYHSNKGKR